MPEVEHVPSLCSAGVGGNLKLRTSRVRVGMPTLVLAWAGSLALSVLLFTSPDTIFADGRLLAQVSASAVLTQVSCLIVLV